MSSGKLKLTITEDSNGQRVHLNSMTLKESKALVVLLDALTTIVEQSTNGDQVKLQVIDGSVELVADAAEKVIKQIEADFQEVSCNRSANKELVESWRKVQDLVKANGLYYKAVFDHGGRSVSILDTLINSKRFKAKSNRRKAEYELLFIDGRLNENGGNIPNLHIIDNSGKKYTIDCTEPQARKVNSLLYQPIKLTVWSKVTSISNYVFCDFYLEKYVFDDFSDFIKSNQDDFDSFLNKLHYKIKGYLDDKDFKTLRQFLRLFIHISSDASTLKTILIITKSFRDNEELKSIRQEIKALLEKKLGRQLT
jgi:hypothetical protein